MKGTYKTLLSFPSIPSPFCLTVPSSWSPRLCLYCSSVILFSPHSFPLCTVSFPLSLCFLVCLYTKSLSTIVHTEAVPASSFFIFPLVYYSSAVPTILTATVLNLCLGLVPFTSAQTSFQFSFLLTCPLQDCTCVLPLPLCCRYYLCPSNRTISSFIFVSSEFWCWSLPHHFMFLLTQLQYHALGLLPTHLCPFSCSVPTIYSL